MNLFAISDLHLSFSSDKPMDIFKGWENYTERLSANWKRLVKEEDTVVIAGDTSWSLKLDETKADFEFLNNLPGKKILIKGNHDLWWSTSSKLSKFFDENKFGSIDFLFNSCVEFEDFAVCGTRGWLYDGTGEKDEKVVKRECSRLETSILSALKKDKEPLVFLHYPPVYGDYVCEEIFSVIEKYDIKALYYGHIHGSGYNNAVSEYKGVKMKLVSCDCVDFTPVFVRQYMKNA